MLCRRLATQWRGFIVVGRPRLFHGRSFQRAQTCAPPRPAETSSTGYRSHPQGDAAPSADAIRIGPSRPRSDECSEKHMLREILIKGMPISVDQGNYPYLSDVCGRSLTRSESPRSTYLLW